MDVKEIREAFEEWLVKPVTDDERFFSDLFSGHLDKIASSFYAGYKAALSTIDPDAIKRECAEIAETIVSESLYDGAGYYQVDIPFMKSAIMGKEAEK